jgi:hypothetical protein
MKRNTLAHLSVTAILCAGGLFTLAPTAAAALPSLRLADDCDPRPNPVMRIVDNLLKGDGQDCADVDPGPSTGSESGTDGTDAVLRGEPPAEESQAGRPAETGHASQPPAGGNNNASTS